MKHRTVFVNRSAIHPIRDGWSCGEAVAINVEYYVDSIPNNPSSWTITAIYVEAHCLDDDGDKAWCWVEVRPEGSTVALHAKLSSHLRHDERATIEKRLKLAPVEPHQSINTAAISEMKA